MTDTALTAKLYELGCAPEGVELFDEGTFYIRQFWASSNVTPLEKGIQGRDESRPWSPPTDIAQAIEMATRLCDIGSGVVLRWVNRGPEPTEWAAQIGPGSVYLRADTPARALSLAVLKDKEGEG